MNAHSIVFGFGTGMMAVGSLWLAALTHRHPDEAPAPVPALSNPLQPMPSTPNQFLQVWPWLIVYDGPKGCIIENPLDSGKTITFLGLMADDHNRLVTLYPGQVYNCEAPVHTFTTVIW